MVSVVTAIKEKKFEKVCGMHNASLSDHVQSQNKVLCPRPETHVMENLVGKSWGLPTRLCLSEISCKDAYSSKSELSFFLQAHFLMFFMY